MNEVIERISLPVFIQIVIECWNSVFLFIMIVTLLVRSVGILLLFGRCIPDIVLPGAGEKAYHEKK